MILDAYESPSHRLLHAVSFVSRFEVPLVRPGGGNHDTAAARPGPGPTAARSRRLPRTREGNRDFVSLWVVNSRIPPPLPSLTFPPPPAPRLSFQLPIFPATPSENPSTLHTRAGETTNLPTLQSRRPATRRRVVVSSRHWHRLYIKVGVAARLGEGSWVSPFARSLFAALQDIQHPLTQLLGQWVCPNS